MIAKNTLNKKIANTKNDHPKRKRDETTPYDLRPDPEITARMKALGPEYSELISVEGMIELLSAPDYVPNKEELMEYIRTHRNEGSQLKKSKTHSHTVMLVFFNRKNKIE